MYTSQKNLANMHPDDVLIVKTHKELNGKFRVSVGCDYNHDGTRAYLLFYESGFRNRYQARKYGKDMLAGLKKARGLK